MRFSIGPHLRDALMSRWLGGVFIWLSAAVAACYGDASKPIPRVGDIGELEGETRLHAVERWASSAGAFSALAVRSGGGLAALIGDEYRTVHLIELRGMPRPPVMGGPVDSVGTATNPALKRPVDVVGVTSRGVAWFLDSAMKRVTSQDISGRRQVIAALDSVAEPQGGCVLDEATLAYIDGARPGTVLIESDSTPVRALMMPRGYVDGRSTRWRDLRFGGSTGSACILWAPRMRSVMLVSASGVRPLGSFIEPVPPDRWFHRLARWVARRPAPVYVLDATSVPGAVAVLYAGQTAGAGRVVDLYDESGGYLRTMVLHAPAHRIAGNRERLYVLRQKEAQVYFASYVLPWSIRRTMQNDQSTRAVGRVDSVAAVMRISRDFRVLPDRDSSRATP